MNIKAVGIVTNVHRDPGYDYTRRVAAWLQEHGIVPRLEESAAQAAGLASWAAPAGLVYKSDFLAVLGGDGTMLGAARQAAPHDTPMLGINLGKLGYLTDVERVDGLDALAKVLAGDCICERRMMLTVNGALALNDVHVYRGGPPGLISLNIHVNGIHMETLRADGVIVATPTGSTAYNLAAGGPVLKPDAEMIALTAKCPHSLHTRPVVLAASDTVSLSPADHSAAVALDGETLFTAAPGASVTIRRAAHTASIIRTTGLDFFSILRRKMNCGPGTPAAAPDTAPIQQGNLI